MDSDDDREEHSVDDDMAEVRCWRCIRSQHLQHQQCVCFLLASCRARSWRVLAALHLTGALLSAVRHTIATSPSREGGRPRVPSA
jgi:hypothetical protein